MATVAVVHASNPRVILASANLRDLGGLHTADGRTVATGLLFRSGHLGDLSEADSSTLAGLGLRTIVDLRRPSETRSSPHPEVDGVEVVHCQVSEDDSEFAVVANRLREATGLVDGPGMVEAYFRRNLTDRLGAYRRVFHLATDPGRLPLLFNCTAGKDRTGFVAAVLLRLLGVPEQVAVADYLLTNEVRRNWLIGREEENRRLIADRRGVDPADVPDAHLDSLRALLWCRAEFICASLSAVVDGWGTWDSFRRDGLGIDDDRFSEFAAAVLR